MRIDALGNVGIGTTLPDTRLHLKQSSDAWDGGFQIEKNAAAVSWYQYIDSGNKLNFNYQATGAALTLNSSGNVGIGATLPTGRLDVGTTRLGVPALFVTEGANVGIGTSAPVFNLQVIGTLDATTITQGGSPITSAFSGITSGTNTSAQMVVGSGANLTYSGTGTINASNADKLQNATWTAPGTIGSGTPSSATS